MIHINWGVIGELFGTAALLTLPALPVMAFLIFWLAPKGESYIERRHIT